MYNNEHSFSVGGKTKTLTTNGQAFIRLLMFVLNEYDVTTKNEPSYRQNLLFFRNQLVLDESLALPDSVRDYWFNRIHNKIMNL